MWKPVICLPAVCFPRSSRLRTVCLAIAYLSSYSVNPPSTTIKLNSFSQIWFINVLIMYWVAQGLKMITHKPDHTKYIIAIFASLFRRWFSLFFHTGHSWLGPDRWASSRPCCRMSLQPGLKKVRINFERLWLSSLWGIWSFPFRSKLQGMQG